MTIYKITYGNEVFLRDAINLVIEIWIDELL